MEKTYFEKVVDVSESLGWKVQRFDDGTICFSQYSPAGEDFEFEVAESSLRSDVWSEYENYDAEDHALFWAEARAEAKNQGRERGIPDLFTLCEDAKAIDKMLEQLACEISKIQEENS